MKGGKYLVVDVFLVLGNGEVADLVRRCNELVQLALGVVLGGPGSFTVGGVFAAGEVLFLAGVDDGDTVGEEDVGGDVLGQANVVGVAIVG